VAPSTTVARFKRLNRICLSLPEATSRGDQHTAYQVRGKTFAYHLNDHHGDGVVALCCKAGPSENRELVASDPVRFYIPPYVGPRGWVGMRLDLASVDWSEVIELVLDSYRLIAPHRLAALAASRPPKT